LANRKPGTFLGWRGTPFEGAQRRSASMQVTFKASPRLVKVGEIGESIVEDDEALRKQLTNFVIAAIYDRNIPLRTEAGFKISRHAMRHVKKTSRQISKNKTKAQLIRFEATIRAEAMKAFDDETQQRAAERRAWHEAGKQAIAQPPERPILNPDAVMQSPVLKVAREEHANLLSDRELREASDWTKERYRKGFILVSEVADWLRKEQGFDVTIVDPSIPTDGELARMLAKWFDKPIDALPQRLREVAKAYIPKWPELSSAERRARANEVDRQLATKLALKIRRADRDREQAKNDPKQVAEGIVAWYDTALDAMTWWGLGSITPHEAAMLLCHFNPQNGTLDPLEITTDETTPDDFKRILRVFEDVARSQPQDRRLSQWHDIAHDRRLKYDPWIDAYRRAVTKSTQTTENAAHASGEAQEKASTDGFGVVPQSEDAPATTVTGTDAAARQRDELEETPKERRAKHDLETERGCRRDILEIWDDVESVHGPSANGRQVLRILTRRMDQNAKPPLLKTIRNRLKELRNQKLIP